MTAPERPFELASRLAARLCHDFSGAAGAIASGLDLLSDPTAPVAPDEALALARDGAQGLAAQIAFARAAFGAGGEPFANDALETLARSLFVSIRPTLEWIVDPASVPAAPGRVLLNFVQLAAGAAATGGLVRAQARQGPDGWRLRVEAVGPRVKLQPEVAAGLEGGGPGAGLAGRWVQAAFVRALVVETAGRCAVRAEAERIVFEAIVPG
jgi:histidine phosphotransferase ChpT